ncbi:MAG: type 4a pilus biogenesis protein PilO [Candidatus Komeilibacteria bacterium]|nr:type 4a pilus biogenesis protein PilO [Candidatus Komeilibacteria bacterium]
MNQKALGGVFLNKYWRLLLGLSMVLLLVIGYFYIISKDLNNWHRLKSEIVVELQSQISQSQQELNRLAKVQQSYSALAAEQQARLSQLSQILPTAADLPQLIVQLESLARQSGFTLAEVNFSSTQEMGQGELDQHLKALTVNVALAGPGDYQNLKRLLTNLEQHIRLLDLLSLSLTAQQQVSQTKSQGYSLQLRTYYWQP